MLGFSFLYALLPVWINLSNSIYHSVLYHPTKGSIYTTWEEVSYLLTLHTFPNSLATLSPHNQGTQQILKEFNWQHFSFWNSLIVKIRIKIEGTTGYNKPSHFSSHVKQTKFWALLLLKSYWWGETIPRIASPEIWYAQQWFFNDRIANLPGLYHQLLKHFS